MILGQGISIYKKIAGRHFRKRSASVILWAFRKWSEAEQRHVRNTQRAPLDTLSAGGLVLSYKRNKEF